MKFFTALMVTLMATAAFAIQEGDFIYKWPKVNGLPINQACATPTTFRSIEPVDTCTGRTYTREACSLGEIEFCRPLARNQQPGAGEYLKTDVQCNARSVAYMEVSRYSTTRTCVEYDTSETDAGRCLRHRSVRSIAPVTYDVQRLQFHNEMGFVDAGTFRYTVPTCY